MGICLDTFRNRGCDSELDNRKDFCVLVCVKDGEWLMVVAPRYVYISTHMYANNMNVSWHFLPLVPTIIP